MNDQPQSILFSIQPPAKVGKFGIKRFYLIVSTSKQYLAYLAETIIFASYSLYLLKKFKS